MSVIAGPNVTLNGLALYLDAADQNSYPGSGTSWFDLSGQNNTGVLTNGPTYSSENNGAIVFDGSNDLVVVNSYASIIPTAAYTKIAWFYLTSYTTANNIISGYNGQHAFWMSSSTTLRAGHGNVSFNTIVGTTIIALNTWYCGAVSFNTTTGWRLYLNGSLENTNASATTFTGNGDVLIGSYGGGNLLTGRISNASVYNRVLTDAEIRQNFNALRGRFGV